ncbi:hypothetical protein LJB42_004646 [Komagataella kurtzmanii]|nr:hypothetical protein LJB42_004646 [Komagataella kurtzmanii]
MFKETSKNLFSSINTFNMVEYVMYMMLLLTAYFLNHLLHSLDNINHLVESDVNYQLLQRVTNKVKLFDEEAVLPFAKNLNRRTERFDPRLPVAAYLRSLQDQYSELPQGTDLNDIPPLEVSFHWDDWLSLGIASTFWDAFDNYNKRQGENAISYEQLQAILVNDLEDFSPYTVHILHSNVEVYKYRTIPQKIVYMSNKGYFELLVTEKEKLSNEGLWSIFHQKQGGLNEFSSLNLIEEVDALDEIYDSKGLPAWDPPFPEELDASDEDFKFNATEELAKVEQIKEPKLEDIFYQEGLQHGIQTLPSDASVYFPVNYVENDPGLQSHHLHFPFFSGMVLPREIHSSVHHMNKAFFLFARQHGYVVWFFYGNLIGWYYNGNNHPWDSDIDAIMPMAEMARMSHHHNNTLIIENPHDGYGTYLLTISPWFTKKTRGGNHIDGRFVDVKRGTYIDLSAISAMQGIYPDWVRDGVKENPKNLALADKNGNWYLTRDILPLRRTIFEGSRSYTVKDIEDTLLRNYGDKVLINTELADHEWHDDWKMWVQKKKYCTYEEFEDYLSAHGGVEYDEDGVLTLEGACGFEEVRQDWIITRESVNLHMKEWEAIQRNESTTEYTAKDLPRYRPDSFKNLLDGVSNHGNGNVGKIEHVKLEHND